MELTSGQSPATEEESASGVGADDWQGVDSQRRNNKSGKKYSTRENSSKMNEWVAQERKCQNCKIMPHCFFSFKIGMNAGRRH